MNNKQLLEIDIICSEIKDLTDTFVDYFCYLEEESNYAQMREEKSLELKKKIQAKINSLQEIINT